jgi:urease accessory protein
MDRRIPLIVLILAVSSLPAEAHTGIGAASGLLAGLSHPFAGLDHLLAMSAVGLWAASLGGRAMWAVPAAFVAAMAIGGGLGAGGMAFPAVELMIGLSVVALGALVALNVKVPAAAGMAIVAAFALAHGHAHGSEMPATASALAYGVGFIAATTILHGVGMGLGLTLQRLVTPALSRIMGGAIAAVGLSLAFAG